MHLRTISKLQIGKICDIINTINFRGYDKMPSRNLQPEELKKETKFKQRFSKFQQRCISSCLVMLCVVGPLLSDVKYAIAENYNNTSITTTDMVKQVERPNIILRAIDGPKLLIEWGQVSNAQKYIMVVHDTANSNPVKVDENVPGNTTTCIIDAIAGHSYSVRLTAWAGDMNFDTDTKSLTIPIQQSVTQSPINTAPTQQSQNITPTTTQQQPQTNITTIPQAQPQLQPLYAPTVNYNTYDFGSEKVIRLNWNSISGAEGYEISGRSFYPNEIINTEKTTGTTCTFRVVPGHTYNFIVTVFDANGRRNCSTITVSNIPSVATQQPIYNPQPTYTQPTQPTYQQPQTNIQAGQQVNTNTTNQNLNIEEPRLSAPYIHMPDVDNTVFYRKGDESILFTWDSISSAKKYKIQITDVTRDGNNVSISETVDSSITSYRFNVIGQHEYKIWVTPLGKYGKLGNRAEYIIEAGRIVTRDLYYGCANGKDVLILNQKLNYLGLNTGEVANQYNEIFKPNAEIAVKAVQSYNGLKAVDGIVGNDTWWTINNLVRQVDEYNRQGKSTKTQKLINSLKECYREANAEKSILGYGMNNDSVKVLQEKLNYLGLYTGGAQGVFGQETYISVKALQKACGRNADGVVGPDTWDSIRDQISIKMTNGDYAYSNNQGKYIQQCREQIVNQIALENQQKNNQNNYNNIEQPVIILDDNSILFTDVQCKWNYIGVDMAKVRTDYYRDKFYGKDTSKYEKLFESNQNLKLPSMTPDRLAFLYLIDPNGVKDYLTDRPEEIKIETYKILTNKEPRYWKHSAISGWKEINKISGTLPNNVITDADILFNIIPPTVVDLKTVAEIAMPYIVMGVILAPVGVEAAALAEGAAIFGFRNAVTMYIYGNLSYAVNYYKNTPAARGRVATVDELIGMINKRPNVVAVYAEGEELAYLRAMEAEASHMLGEKNISSILIRQDVATRRTVFHEWLHRYLQLNNNGSARPNEDKIIEDFLTKHSKILHLDG